MKLTLITIGLMCMAFIGGFSLSTYVRQELLDELHREIMRFRDVNEHMHETLDSLVTEIAALRRTIGMNHRA